MESKYLYIFLHLNKAAGTTINASLYKELDEDEFVHIGQPWANKKERRKRFEKRPLKVRAKARFVTGHNAYYGLHHYVPNKIPRYFTILRCPAERLVSYYNHEMSSLSESEIIPFMKWYNLRKKNEILEFYNQRIKMEKQGNLMRFRLIHFLSSFSKLFPWHNSRLNFGRFILKKIKAKQNIREVLNKKFERVKELLQKMWYVGIVDTLDDDLSVLFKCFRVNVSDVKRYNVTGSKESSNPFNKNAVSSHKLFKLDGKTKKIIYNENPIDVKLYKFAKKLNKLKINSINDDTKKNRY